MRKLHRRHERRASVFGKRRLQAGKGRTVDAFALDQRGAHAGAKLSAGLHKRAAGDASAHGADERGREVFALEQSRAERERRAGELADPRNERGNQRRKLGHCANVRPKLLVLRFDKRGEVIAAHDDRTKSRHERKDLHRHASRRNDALVDRRDHGDGVQPFIEHAAILGDASADEFARAQNPRGRCAAPRTHLVKPRLRRVEHRAGDYLDHLADNLKGIHRAVADAGCNVLDGITYVFGKVHNIVEEAGVLRRVDVRRRTDEVSGRKMQVATKRKRIVAKNSVQCGANAAVQVGGFCFDNAADEHQSSTGA